MAIEKRSALARMIWMAALLAGVLLVLSPAIASGQEEEEADPCEAACYDALDVCVEGCDAEDEACESRCDEISSTCFDRCGPSDEPAEDPTH